MKKTHKTKILAFAEMTLYLEDITEIYTECVKQRWSQIWSDHFWPNYWCYWSYATLKFSEVLNLETMGLKGNKRKPRWGVSMNLLKWMQISKSEYISFFQKRAFMQLSKRSLIPKRLRITQDDMKINLSKSDSQCPQNYTNIILRIMVSVSFICKDSSEYD